MPADVRCYRVEGDGLAPAVPDGAVVVVDSERSARDGDLVAVDADGVLIGHLLDAGADPVLVWPHRAPRPLDGSALLGVVALVVSAP